MFSHVMIGANDLDRSKRFYDALFAAMDGPEGQIDFKGRLAYAHKGGRLLITLPIDGEAATSANGGTIGFLMDSPEQVQAWHSAGINAGGLSIEDPPGVRQGPAGQIYLAYLRDLDGNKLCGVYRVPAA
jgi:catechol 2,3-dioxygenase-like lactoylglutathione lyase family enzyme